MSTSGMQMWKNERQRIKHIAEDYLKLEPELIEELTQCKTEFGFFVRLVRDNGIVEHLKGWRIQHCNPYDTGRKPHKGGFMRATTVGRDMLRAKAAIMTWKCAVVGPTDEERIQFGGAKGGLCCDPLQYSESETKRQMEGVADEINPIVGPTWDSIGPDVAVGPKEIRAFVTRYSRLNKDKGIPCGAVATGKPLEHGGGGCPGRIMATGLGMHFVYEELSRIHPFFRNMPDRPRAIVQGFGQVGSAYAILAEQFGITIIGVSDIYGGIYNPNGIDIQKLSAINKKTRRIDSYPEAELVSCDEFLKQECDILVLAATENVLTEKNASLVKAPMILEGANAPTTPEADLILRGNNQLVIPDILSNAGGVTVSYFEWCQDMQGKFWREKEIKNELKRYMVGGARRTFQTSQKFAADLRTGAGLSAITYCAPALREKHGFKKSPKSLV
ncbi:MAG: Glu/Leu/Phe/Val dehydrogenase [Candidatus Sungbacteria bacterium]|nr:Glu/Leu/Phe/Val dehydrogenase [Candidatus Sungbacteria bacterium]